MRFLKFGYLFILIVCYCMVGYAATKQALPPIPVLKDIKLVSQQGENVRIDIVFDRAVPLTKYFGTQNPNTLVLDFPVLTNQVSPAESETDFGALDGYRIVTAENKTRIIFKLIGQPNYRLIPKGNVIQLTFSAPKVYSEKHQIEAFKPVGVRSSINHRITSIDFTSSKNNSGEVMIKLSDPQVNADVQDKSGKIIVDFHNTAIASQYLQSLDVRDFSTPVQTINVVRRGTTTRLVIVANTPYQHMAYQVNNRFVIDIQGQVEAQKETIEEKKFTGKRLSLNFQNIGVRQALQIISQFAQINMVVSDSVKGNMTLRLDNVPWDQALAIIMETRGLGEQRIGDTYLIAPADEILARERSTLAAKQQVASLEPMRSELIQVNYGKAEDIAKLLRGTGGVPILSSRGSVSVDERTNTLWVQDTTDKLSEVRDLIKRLDVPVPQVLIEARLVSIDRDALDELGVRWGISNSTHLSGTLGGASDIANGVAPSAVPFNRRLNVDLPSTNVDSLNPIRPGSVGIALAKLGGGILLDLELSALQSQDEAKIIASPRLVTANQKEAYIEAGEEIPYQEASSSGATTVAFKKAVLSLRVTPQITPDNRIVLNLKVNQDKRGTPDVLGVPPIDTREIDTQVLVNNGETIVLGGIYQHQKGHIYQRIPFFSDIPVIGNLFKHNLKTEIVSELVVFITPRIVNKSFYQ